MRISKVSFAWLVAHLFVALAQANGSSDWWAIKDFSQAKPPVRAADQWSTNEIDRFVYDRMEEMGLEPAPEASRRVLVRRLYYGVLGLPPSPKEIEEFLSDHSPNAWERLVDQLLDDHRYGEHMARQWLDLVRYSESDGWNKDGYRPRIWRYRDYVVKSFNQDKPYRDFVLEQLAGDEMPRPSPEALVATGFLRLGVYEYNQRNARKHWDDIMNETTDVVGDVFLGLSMACARCHDHKFDPLLQSDYFQLKAFFEPISWQDDLIVSSDKEKAHFAKSQRKWEAATKEIREEIAGLEKPYRDRKWDSTVDKFPLEIQECFHKPADERNSWENQMAYLVSRQFYEEGRPFDDSIKGEDKKKWVKLFKQLKEFDHLKPKPLARAMGVTFHKGQIAETRIPENRNEKSVPPGFPKIMRKGVQASPQGVRRRTALAEWITNPENTLTHRVIVNRLWQQHFGQGLVRTPSDFGQKGARPTHPELLDWLCQTFIEHGGRFRPLHRAILLSSTWRQSSHHPEAAAYQNQDPDEKGYWRSPIRRLRAEQLRDAMLSLSGELNSELGGPSVDHEVPRRSLYVKNFRNKVDSFLKTFDAASGLKSVPERDATTTPIQSLLLMNGEFALARAKAWSMLFRDTSEKTLEEMFLTAWGRPPSLEELDEARSFVGDERERLDDFAHVLLNSSEFFYLD